MNGRARACVLELLWKGVRGFLTRSQFTAALLIYTPVRIGKLREGVGDGG